MGMPTPTNQSNPTSAPQGKGPIGSGGQYSQMNIAQPTNQQTNQYDGIARPQGKGGLSQGLLNRTTPGNLGNDNNPEYGHAPMGSTGVENMPTGLPQYDNMPVPAGGMNGRPQQATQGLGKGSSNSSTPFAQGGNVTYPGQGGQPQMGKPNIYSNTVGPWDNASIQPRTQSGKGKGY